MANKKAAAEKAADPHPEVRALFNKLTAEKDALQKKSAPLRKQRDAIVAKIQPLETQERELSEKIRAIELPRMGELDMQISGLARALGGRRMSEPEP